MFGVPEDFPDPREDEAAHDAALAQAVTDLAHAADGGLFVLFTSHAALRRAAQQLRGMLDPRWPLLVQGESSRDTLLRRFRDAGNAILLGTDSFWEGVDVPGRALRGLVLCKLPFMCRRSRSRRPEIGWPRWRGWLHGVSPPACGAQAHRASGA
jgi:ATP-dependent DNA helicase DinG